MDLSSFDLRQLRLALKAFKKPDPALFENIVDEAVIEENEGWRAWALEAIDSIRFSRACSILFSSNSRPVKNLLFSLKNSIYIEDKLASGASNALVNHYPPFSSTVYRKLVEGEAVYICSSALDELGMGNYGVFGNSGILPNAFAPERACGGSSSGGAYLVAKGIVDFALGTDTGGSIRTPASYNNIYGFKPSFGLISREGILPLSTLLDTVGILSNSLSIVARVLSVISAADPLDLSTLRVKKKNYHSFSSNPLKDLSLKVDNLKSAPKFLIFSELLEYPQDRLLTQQERELKQNYQNLISRLKAECTLRSASFSFPPFTLAELVYKIVAYSDSLTHYFSLNGLINPWEKKSNLEDKQVEKKGSGESVSPSEAASENVLEGSESDLKKEQKFNKLEVCRDYLEKAKKIREQLGTEVKMRHLLGYFFLYQSNYYNLYLQARKLLGEYIKRFSGLLENGEILITPTTSTIAPLLSNISGEYVKDKCSSILLLANFAGCPAISIPWLEVKTKLDSATAYFGIHLSCKKGEDKYLLSVASYLERFKLL